MEKEQLEKITRDYQMIQEQLQALTMQREQFAGQKAELKDAMESLEKSTGKVFYAVGGAIVELTKEAAIKDIKEKQDSTEMRLSILSKQYDELSKREQSLRADITNELKAAGQ
jgi:prefoldin beta subunit